MPAVRPGGAALVTHGPGRALGLKVQPVLRLSLGYQDPERDGAPVKTDYFVLRGVEFPELQEKFHEEFGERPREIPIMLPARLEDAIELRHKAFSGGAGSPGALRAIGRTNFAERGTLGGPDILQVWDPNGEIVEFEISGVEDPRAQELKVELTMTFTFGIPRVLGIGAFAAVDSKGKQSIDTLWSTLDLLYAMFGSRVSIAVEPVLFLRKASTRYRKMKNGAAAGWGTSQFYALDLRVPETLDEMLERLRARDSLLFGEASILPGGLPSSAPAADVAAAANADEPEDVPGEVVDEPAGAAPPASEGLPDGQQQFPGVQASRAQVRKLNAILGELTSGRSGSVVEIVDLNGDSFTPDDWVVYARTWIMREYQVDSVGKLDAAQLDALVEHLDKLTIPF